MKNALSIGVFVLGALTAASSAQSVPQQRAAVGQQAWSSDGFLYQMTANGWARTPTSRRGTAAVYDTHLNGKPQIRYDTSKERGWVHEYHHQTGTQVKYPANNPKARYTWVDSTSSGGPRAWLSPAQTKTELERLVGLVNAQNAQAGRARGVQNSTPGLASATLGGNSSSAARAPDQPGMNATAAAGSIGGPNPATPGVHSFTVGPSNNACTNAAVCAVMNQHNQDMNSIWLRPSR